MLVPGAGSGAGAVSWLCTWWRQGAGAGAVHVVETGAGAGAGCRLCAWFLDRVPGAGCRALVLGAGYRCWVLVLGAVGWRAGARCWCEGRPTAASDSEVPAVMGRMNLYARNIIRCCRLNVLCLLALWGIYTLQVLFWPTAVSRAVLFARTLLYV